MLIELLRLWLDFVVIWRRFFILLFLRYWTGLHHQVWIRVGLGFNVRGCLRRLLKLLFLGLEVPHCIGVDPVGTTFFIFWGVEEFIIVALLGEDLRAPGVGVSDSWDVYNSADRVERAPHFGRDLANVLFDLFSGKWSE